MKIGIDARLWEETGVGRYIRNLVAHLQELDHTNDYVLFVKDTISQKDLHLTNPRWKIVRTNIRWHTLTEQVKFPQLLNKENLDLVHFPYFSIPIFYQRPYVITIHEVFYKNNYLIRQATVKHLENLSRQQKMHALTAQDFYVDKHSLHKENNCDMRSSDFQFLKQQDQHLHM